MTNTQPIRVAIVDDHTLVRGSLSDVIVRQDMEVVAQYADGVSFLNSDVLSEIDVVLMDYQMPGMNGVECCRQLQSKDRIPRVLALSMNEDEITITSMIRAGARGYISKNAETEDLLKAIRDVHEHGFHFSNLVPPQLALAAQEEQPNNELPTVELTSREVEFLKRSCSEKTYKEIADEMCVSVRTIDGYRDDLFAKLGIKNRVGLVLYAIKEKLYEV